MPFRASFGKESVSVRAVPGCGFGGDGPDIPEAELCDGAHLCLLLVLGKARLGGFLSQVAAVQANPLAEASAFTVP